MEADLVGGEERSLDAHSAEGSGTDASVRVSAEWASPVFELVRFTGGLFYEKLDRVLVGEKVASLYRVISMRVKAVVFACDRGHSPFRRDGVAAHRVDFRDDCNIELGRKIDGCYLRA